jgi:hypothetical protein
MLTGLAGAEAVACLAERALAEGERLGWLHLEDQSPAMFVLEGAVSDLIAPAPVPLPSPGARKPMDFGAPVTLTAVPSTTMSVPCSQSLHPVVRTTYGLCVRLTAFCSLGPVQKSIASPSQTATSGVVCGLPSRRTVVIQKSSALSSVPRVVPARGRRRRRR